MNRDYFLYYYFHPAEWIRDYLNVLLWEKQKEIADALVAHDDVAVRSGHDLGKTFLAACIVIWYLYTHPMSKVVTTAPTSRQAKKQIWGEIQVLHQKLEGKIEPLGELLQTELRLGPGWWGMGFSTDDPNAFQGIHEENLLFIGDEACGIEREILETSEAITTAEGNKRLLIGNPTEPNTYFHWAFTGKVPGFHKIKMSCFDSPNIITDENGNYTTKRPIPYPKLVTMKFINRSIRTYGIDSPFVRSRVFGEFPELSTDQLLDGRHLALAVQKGILLRSVTTELTNGERVLSSTEVAELKGRNDEKESAH